MPTAIGHVDFYPVSNKKNTIQFRFVSSNLHRILIIP